MGDNGSGEGGGNGSVYWSVTHGSAQRPSPIGRLHAPAFTAPSGAPLTVVAGSTVGVLSHPNRGEVVVSSHQVEGHTDTNFNQIGVSNPPTSSDHPGKFKVRLRFREQDLSKLDAADVKWIMQRAKPNAALATDNSFFLEIDVPAIERRQPANGDEWENLPWEIRWEW